MNLMDLYVKIGADTSGFDKGVKGTKESANGLKTVFFALGNAAQTVGLKSKTAATQHKVLSAELKDAQAKVKALSSAYTKAANETGTTSKKTKELQEKLRDAEKEAKDLEAELAKYPSTMKKAQAGMAGFGGALGKIGGVAASGVGVLASGVVAATAAAGAAITALGAIGLNYNSQMETYTTNFEVMLGSSEAAAKKVEELKTLSAKTPFEMGDLAQATQTLLAFNVANEDTTGILTMLGDISMGNAQKLDSLSRAYGKMNASQKVSLEDINMMIDAGFNPLLLVAEKTGESMTDLYKRVSDGKVAVSEITDAMTQATSEGGQFYKGMEKASTTMQGLISTLKDNAQALVGKVFQPISEGLTSTLLPAAIEAVDELTTAFDEGGVEGMVMAAGNIMTQALAAFVQHLPEFMNLAFQLIQTVVTGIQTNLPSITQAAIETFMAFFMGLANMLPQLLDMAYQIIYDLATYLLADDNMETIVNTAVELFMALIDTMIEWLPELIPLAFQIVVKLATALVENIPRLAEKALELGKAVVQGIIDGIQAAWQGLVDWFNGLWDSLFGGRSVDVSVNGGGADGSHAGGLDYVPYNGYMAQLHRGEMVLTRQEAEDYRRGNAAGFGSGVVVNQTIYAAKQTPVELAATTKAYFQRARWAAPRRARA